MGPIQGHSHSLGTHSPFVQLWSLRGPSDHHLLTTVGRWPARPRCLPESCAVRATHRRPLEPRDRVRTPAELRQPKQPARSAAPHSRGLPPASRTGRRAGRGSAAARRRAERREEGAEPRQRGGAWRKGPIRESPRPGRKGWRRELPGAFPARPVDSLQQESPGPPGTPSRRYGAR